VVAKAPEPVIKEPAYPESDAPTSVDRSHRISVPSGVAENVCLSTQTPPLPVRARVLFALAVLSLDKAEGVSLTELSAKAAVPPVAFLSQLKKMGNAGIVQVTPASRVLLTHQPTAAIGGAQLFVAGTHAAQAHAFTEEAPS
jgi:hypothetical protein